MARRQLEPKDLRPDWKEELIELGKNGKNNEDAYKLLGITHSTFIRMVKRNEEFRIAYEEYLKYHESYWINKVKEAIIENGGSEIDTRLFVLLMGNKQRKIWKRK